MTQLLMNSMILKCSLIKIYPSWCAYLNGEEVDYFMIEFVGSKYCINPFYLVVNEMRLMLRLGFQVVLVHVKKSCRGCSKSFVQKLNGNFKTMS
jgi:hypothetical protein